MDEQSGESEEEEVMGEGTAPNRGGQVQTAIFDQYLSNDTRYGTLIGTCMCSIDWCYFR